jgi:3' terminal RNA ribose 2'-O-methyltransferase Hen1
VGEDEVEKLLRQGEGWLAAHPARELIVKRYLPHGRHLAEAALARLAEEDLPDAVEAEEGRGNEERELEKPMLLWQQRIGAILAALKSAGAARVADLGCGEGKILKALIEDRSFQEILGMDVSHRSLEIAGRRLRLEQLPPKQRERIRLIHGSLMYRDARLAGYDAAVVAEVIEHLDPPRLAAFERVVFEHAKPATVVLTTPNAEYNALFPALPEGQFRHKDHRFEWTRPEFEQWASGVAAHFGYSVKFLPVGQEDAALGAPTQMGIFSR